jgi:hypothetical protein
VGDPPFNARARWRLILGDAWTEGPMEKESDASKCTGALGEPTTEGPLKDAERWVLCRRLTEGGERPSGEKVMSLPQPVCADFCCSRKREGSSKAKKDERSWEAEYLNKSEKCCCIVLKTSCCKKEVPLCQQACSELRGNYADEFYNNGYRKESGLH